MAGSVNKVMLIGNLGRAPEIRQNQAGDKIASLSVATSESWKDKQSGERRERTEWHRVVIFNPHLAEIAEKYLEKGSRVYLSGALKTRKWTDKSGVDRYTTEVVLSLFRGELEILSSASNGPPSSQDESEYGQEKAAASGSSSTPDYNAPLDDEIPF